MNDVQLQYVIDKLRTLHKPRHVFVNKQKFDNFIKAPVGWTGSVGLWKRKQNDDDSIMVELTPDLQLLLKYIYDKEKKENPNEKIVFKPKSEENGQVGTSNQ